MVKLHLRINIPTFRVNFGELPYFLGNYKGGINMYNEIIKDLDWFFKTPDMPKVHRYPLTNLGIDKDDNLIIEIAIAGFTRDEIKIEQHGNKIIVKGSKQEQNNDIKYFQQRISTSDFERIIVLHDKYVDGEITANMENGILTLKIKPSNKNYKLIEIK